MRATKNSRDRYMARILPPTIPESRTPVYDDFHVVRSDDLIVVSDLEVPDQDGWMLRAALLTAMRHGIKKVLFAGDLIATDQDALNTWLTTYRDEHGTSYRADLNVLRTIMNQYGQWFTEGMWQIMGNHDLRIDKATGGEVTLGDLLDDTAVKFSPYSYMYLWMPLLREWVYICHQFRYRKQPVSLAQDIWANEVAPDGSKSKMHVIVTHTHLEQRM